MAESDSLTVTIPRRAARRSLVYLLLATVLLANPLYLSGWHLDDDVYRYEAARLEPNATHGVVAVDLDEDERELDPDLENVGCDGAAISRECMIEYRIQSGEVNVSVPVSDFGYSEHYRYYLLYNETTSSTQFYRPVATERGEGNYSLAHEAVPTETVLERLSVPASELSDASRDVLDSGSRITYRELPAAGQVIERGGQYFLVYAAAAKTYSPGFTSCGSEGEGFCAEARNYRRGPSVLTAGATLGGLLSLALGLRVLWRSVSYE